MQIRRKPQFNIFHLAKWCIETLVNNSWKFILASWFVCVLSTTFNIQSTNWDEATVKWNEAKSHFELCKDHLSQWDACRREKVIVDKYPFVMALQKTSGDLPLIIMDELNPLRYLQGSYMAYFAILIFVFKYIWKCSRYSVGALDKKTYQLKLERDQRNNEFLQYPMGYRDVDMVDCRRINVK